ncbi:RdgB/HAM1 family non-canonical purine NTP pyrophosphatase [Ferrimicrobium acidiphilum]|uniref:RdgB/HAM1 family non-canonical purine NTP pyrophosphatase n=1 Tax=Ferrimicrobium acidiphilum TaxID=121039 RepID=UPI0023F30F8D|nr:RdgB/HAM1 family non-canonical purine NTP pyrophosphatase [Ferrimicrobium acidiphilum]
MPVVVLGLVTSNQDKLAEIAAMLPKGFRVQRLDLGEVDETGASFEENAELKAIAGLMQSSVALGEDSGLEVEALHGAPGVYSKRYAETDVARVRRLLTELRDVEDRRARFVTVIAMAQRRGVTQFFRGEVEGHIAREPRGTHGFGYDPVFVPNEGDGRTFAQMTQEEKGSISHRGRALASLVANVDALVDLREE